MYRHIPYLIEPDADYDTHPPTYRYVIDLECGAEICTDAPHETGLSVPCGHTIEHRTSRVVTSRPERRT